VHDDENHAADQMNETSRDRDRGFDESKRASESSLKKCTENDREDS